MDIARKARREKRTAARMAEAERRRDFLSALNLDLLTGEQRKLHAEYAEAINVRDAMRLEILALRQKGEVVPEEMQRRLDDAESVIRADADEERRVLREAAIRAHGLDDVGIRSLFETLEAVDAVF